MGETTGAAPIAISRSALDVEWRRMQIIAQNIANQNSAGGGYRALRLISGPAGGFGPLVSPSDAAPAPRGVAVTAIEAQQRGARRVHDPAHPLADAQGYVDYPAIDHAAEMALMVKTARVYESNLTALSLAQQMNARALELGAK